MEISRTLMPAVFTPLTESDTYEIWKGLSRQAFLLPAALFLFAFCFYDFQCEISDDPKFGQISVKHKPGLNIR